jgi:hypothetical protein
MRKVLLVMVMASLLLTGGCAGKNPFTALGEAVGTVAEKVCNFNLEDSKEAQAALDLVAAAAPIVGPVLGGVQVTKEQAKETFTAVINAAQTGGCVLLTDLKLAISYFDALLGTQKAMGVRMLPTMGSLRAKAKM